jgi:hypothetical protein
VLKPGKVTIGGLADTDMPPPPTAAGSSEDGIVEPDIAVVLSEVAGAPAPTAVQIFSFQFKSQHSHLQQLFKCTYSASRGNGNFPSSNAHEHAMSPRW